MLLGAEKGLPSIGQVDNKVRKFLGPKIILQWLIGAIWSLNAKGQRLQLVVEKLKSFLIYLNRITGLEFVYAFLTVKDRWTSHIYNSL